MSGMDSLYKAMIENLCDVIGYEAAYHLLSEEAIKRCDATTRQALDLDGGFAKEVAEILKENPAWDLKFEKTGDGFGLVASIAASATTEEELADQKRRIQEAFDRYKQINLPGVKLSVRTERRTIDTAEE